MLKKSVLSNYQPRLRVTQIPVILIPGVMMHQKHSRVAKSMRWGIKTEQGLATNYKVPNDSKVMFPSL